MTSTVAIMVARYGEGHAGTVGEVACHVSLRARRAPWMY